MRAYHDIEIEDMVLKRMVVTEFKKGEDNGTSITTGSHRT
jgi:hypothetical protein